MLGLEHAAGAVDLANAVVDVHRHADRAALVRDRPLHRLADPPRRVRRELQVAAPLELLDGAHQPDRALLDQIQEADAVAAVLLGDRHDQPQVGLDHPLLGCLVPRLDPLGELLLLVLGEQRRAPDLGQVEVKGIDACGRVPGRRRRGLLLRRAPVLVQLPHGDHVDTELGELVAQRSRVLV